MREVLAGYRLDRNGIHGPNHLLRVRANGLAPAAQTPGADVRAVELFTRYLIIVRESRLVE